jgi:hypothetical protein
MPTARYEIKFYTKLQFGVGRDSGRATHCRMDGRVIGSRWGINSPLPCTNALGPNRSPVKWVPVLFPGSKMAEAC